nr:acetylxylan esterase [uncultured Carboxylicivirga sp.]
MKKIFSISFLLISALLNSYLHAQVTVKPDHEDGVYKKGETVSWTVSFADTSKLDSLHYMILPGALKATQENLLSLKDTVITYTFKSPESVLLKIGWKNAENKIDYAIGGAIADPQKLKLSDKKPKDFDAFWESKVEELEKVPVNAQLQKGSCDVEGVDYYKISMDNIRGSKIQGQLVKPSGGKKLPAMLVVQWAGVYPLEKDWVQYYAKEGWLVLNILAHDLPIDNEKQFYDDQFKNELKDYWMIGNEDKNESYFLRMYLSCYRAAEYLTNRDDWNGETLIVTGTSQGGMQALMTAGFFPGITACVALVPAGFDMMGPTVGRRGGWPQWYDCTWGGRDADKVHEASKYYDVANFVRNIKCPVYVGVGLIDEVCPLAGIIAGLNQLKEKNKEVMILVDSPHQNVNGSQEPFNHMRDKVWFPALKDGKRP